jgi:hypothetical protein
MFQISIVEFLAITIRREKLLTENFIVLTQIIGQMSQSFFGI